MDMIYLIYLINSPSQAEPARFVPAKLCSVRVGFGLEGDWPELEIECWVIRD